MQQVRILPRFRLSLLLVALPVALVSGCVITSDDGSDDGASDGSGGGDGNTNADAGGDGSGGGDGGGDGADDNPGDGNADDTTDGGDGGGSGDAPEEGTWLYEETGGTTNTCDFLEDISNGWGDFTITHDGAGAFTITPGDETDPFPCTYGGGTFACPGRLVDEISSGASSLSVTVRVEGSVDSATALSGSQLGEVTCTGPDCATAETLLMTTFPCAFEVPFTADKV